MRTRTLALAGVVALALAGCRSATPTPDPTLAFCDSLKTLAASVATLEQVNASSTVDDVQADLAALQSAVAEVKETAGTLAQDQVAQIQAAAQQLADFGETVEGSETLGEVATSFAQQVAALKAARAQAGTVHCGEAEIDAAASAAVVEASAAVVEVEASASAAAEEIEAEASALAEEVEAEASAAAEEIEGGPSASPGG